MPLIRIVIPTRQYRGSWKSDIERAGAISPFKGPDQLLKCLDVNHEHRVDQKRMLCAINKSFARTMQELNPINTLTGIGLGPHRKSHVGIKSNFDEAILQFCSSLTLRRPRRP